MATDIELRKLVNTISSLGAAIANNTRAIRDQTGVLKALVEVTANNQRTPNILAGALNDKEGAPSPGSGEEGGDVGGGEAAGPGSSEAGPRTTREEPST